MSNLILPNRFTSQPQYPAPIDWRNPITRGIISAQSGLGFDHVTGAGAYLDATAISHPVTSKGVGFSASSTNRLSFPVVPYPLVNISGVNGTFNDSLLYIGTPETADWNAGNNNHGLGFTANGSNHGFANSYNTSTASGALWTGVATVIGVSNAGPYAASSVWVDGVQKTGLGLYTTPISANTSQITSASGQTGILSVRWIRPLTTAEVASLTANPWQIFKAPQRRIWVAGTGTVWNVSISESVSLSEALSAIAGFQGVQSEALTLTESQSATNLAVVSASESIALADAPSSGVATGASISEAMALVESITAALNAAASVAESIALSETSSAAASFSAAIAESVTLADSLAASAQFSAVMAEALALADTSSTSGQVISATISESMALVDTWAATAALSAAIVEAGALTDSVQATAQFGVVQVETLALTESPAAGTVWTVSISELMTLADVVNWAGDLVATPGYRVALAAQKRQVKLTETNWRTTLPVTIRIVKIRKELP